MTDCIKAKDGKHVYKFGKCSLCAKAEGKLLAGFGNFLDADAVAGSGCPKTLNSAGKHDFKFGKCKACGVSEASYNAAVKNAKRGMPASLLIPDEPPAAAAPAPRKSPLARAGASVMSESPKPAAPKPAAAPAAAAAAPAKKNDVLSRLTDASKYTGAHKARFDADGKGRGMAGRDAVRRGVGGGDLSELTRSNLN